MKLYFDNDCNEIVTKEVARSRMKASVDGSDIMYHLYHHVSWGELQKHIVDDDFFANIIDKITDGWFDDRFCEYELIESE